MGTGTCVPRSDRRGACTLVRAGTAALCVDLGLGALHGLLELGVAHRELDALLLTHLHPDHTAELVPFLFAANYDETPRARPLLLAGGPGTRVFVDSLRSAHGHWLDPRGYELEVREVEPGDAFELGGARVRAGAVRHIPSSVAYRVEAGGRSLVVSGDTGPSAELEAFARGADLLVIEASLPEGSPGEGHLTAGQAGALARRAAVRDLVLVHLYPAADAAGPERAAAEAFGGPVRVARDGEAFRLTREP